MENTEVAKFFWEIAKLLELKQDNPFRIRAYQRAAENIESFAENVAELIKRGGEKELRKIPGVGKDIAENIIEIVKTGKLKKHTALLKQFPKYFLDIIEIQGVGPKTAIKLLKKFKINSIKKLERAAKQGLLENIPGMGLKKEQNILRGITLKKQSQGRFLLDVATKYASAITSQLRKLKEIIRILPCGSLRRGKETIGDIDILAISDQPKKIMDTFVKLTQVKSVLAKGPTKSSVILENNMQADLRVIKENGFGAAAHYFTGSKEHNIRIREIAQKHGLKVNEYGIFKGNKQVAGKTEEEMYKYFGFDYIPPELREDRGEWQAAKEHKLPDLIEVKDIKGDLHMHTKATDGMNTIEEMAKACKELKYEYLAITDHSKSTRVAGGLDEKETLKHLKEIERANAKINGIRILKGVELDILPDGSLDFSDGLLKEMDIVLISIHSNFNMPKNEMTKRIIKAMQNKYASILCHPSGRLLGKREAYQIDEEAVLKAAKDTGTFIEINSQPERLDLTDSGCIQAKKHGVLISINTDSHSILQFENMKYGVLTARRGWLEAKNVINTLPLNQMLKKIQQKRK